MKRIWFILMVGLLASGAAAAPVKSSKEAKPVTTKITQTAGRTQLGNFAPEFAHYNDDILFGENWKKC